MRQQQQGKHIRERKPVPPDHPPGQSFASAVHEAMKWSGTIPDQKGRKTDMSAKFMGVPMQQSWPDLLIWEAFFNSYNVRTFIELGTGYGGLALFFALQCRQHNIEFHTFDNVKSFKDDTLSMLMELESHFHHVDLFKEGHGLIRQIIETGTHPLAIFFDDGDKPREWRTFAPMTRTGDFCIVHDWGTEFFESDLGGVKVERIFGQASDARSKTDWKSMWFYRT